METTAKTHIQRLSLTRCNLAAVTYCNNVSHFGNIESAGMGQKDLNKRSFCLLILPEMANMLCTSKLSLLLKKKDSSTKLPKSFRFCHVPSFVFASFWEYWPVASIRVSVTPTAFVGSNRVSDAAVLRSV